MNAATTLNLVADPLFLVPHPAAGLRRLGAGRLVQVAAKWRSNAAAFLRLQDPAGGAAGDFVLARVLDCPLGVFAILRTVAAPAGTVEGVAARGFAVARLLTPTILQAVAPEEIAAIMHWLQADMALATWDPREADAFFGPMTRLPSAFEDDDVPVNMPACTRRRA